MPQPSTRRLQRALRRVTRPSFWQREARSARVLKPAYFSIALRWFSWLLAVIFSTAGVALAYNTANAPVMLVITGLWLGLQSAYLPFLRAWLAALPGGAGRRLVRLVDRGPLVSILDLGLSFVTILVTGGYGSPFYIYGLTSVVMPALLFGFRAALIAGVAFGTLFLLAALLVTEGARRAFGPGAVDGMIGFTVVPTPLALFSAYLGRLTRDLVAERDRVRQALLEASLLRTITESGLRLVADPATFVARTVDLMRRRLRLPGLAIVYRQPADGDPVAGAAAEKVLGYGPALALAHGQALADATGTPAPLVLALSHLGGDLGRLIATGPAVSGQRAFLVALASQVSAALASAHLHAEARALAAQAERARLAREIHDGIAQSMFMLTLSLEACVDLTERDPAQARVRLEELADLSRQTLWQTRHYVHDLKPLLVDARGLGPALRSQVREFATISGLDAALALQGDETELALSTRQALYRIAQEALANVFKHAGASAVEVLLEFSSATVTLVVADNGAGFRPNPGASGGQRGYGLTNMRQRCEELGGRFDLTSELGVGTTVRASLPLVVEAVPGA